jgi:hypothetical protein
VGVPDSGHAHCDSDNSRCCGIGNKGNLLDMQKIEMLFYLGIFLFFIIYPLTHRRFTPEECKPKKLIPKEEHRQDVLFILLLAIIILLVMPYQMIFENKTPMGVDTIGTIGHFHQIGEWDKLAQKTLSIWETIGYFVIAVTIGIWIFVGIVKIKKIFFN